MKKILLILIFFLAIPIANANTDMDIDSYIKDNGDILIKKVIKVYGDYNGFQIVYDDTYDGEYAIYNASSMEIVKVCTTKTDIFSEGFSTLECFQRVNSANKGDSKSYTFKENTLTMYNPSSKMKGESFYIEYLIKNVVVKYDDIADLRLSIFDTGFSESINNFEMRIHLPSKDSNFRIWGHGVLYGNTERSNDDTGLINITNLPSYSPVDIRLTFDRNLIPNSNKISNKIMFDKIIEEETEKANNANNDRDEARDELERIRKEQEKLDAEREKERIEKEAKDLKSFTFFSIPWVIGLLGLLGYNYFKNDKELEPDFKNQYFRDFPDDASPEEARLLIENTIDSISLSSSLLNIVRKKGFIIEEFSSTEGLIIKKEVKDYKFTLVDHTLIEPLTSDEKYVRSWFIDFYGDKKNSFVLSSMKKRIKNQFEAEKFMKKYNHWKSSINTIFNAKSTYEKNASMKILIVVFSLFPFLVGMLMTNTFIMGLALVIIPLSIYLLTSKKRTKLGNERYYKWRALKNFMNDFGRFEEKELPEVYLWEKYLVYANAFGLADKLKQQMQIRIQNVDTTVYNDEMFNYIMLNNIINNSITTGVSASIASATAALERVASSSDSSGGGFGGGFSSGGSFGGGGGMSGGRF